MLPALLLVALVALPVAVHAATPTQRAEAEAKQYLASCDFADDGWQQRCRWNQYNFILSYVLALSGDTPSMGAVVASFSPASRSSQEDVNDHIGLTVSFEQACAWRIALATFLNLTPPPDAVGLLCLGLPVADTSASAGRAQQILTVIQTSPPRPTPDWEPTVAGLPPAPNMDRRCRITISSAGQISGPAKGCPGPP
jgi:hypothetical protein